MEVIEFPGAAVLNKRSSKVKKEKIHNSPQNKLIIDCATFTCPKCQQKISINFNGMIFRLIDFHCGKCGTRYKVSNPAFSNLAPSSNHNKHSK